MDDQTLIARLRELHELATPAPWYTLDPPWLTSGNTSILAESPDPHVARFICDFDLWALEDDEERVSENPDSDAKLVVAMRNALPHLLARIEALTAEIEAAVAAKLPETPTPAMIAAAWEVVNRQKGDLGIAKLGPGLGVREIYEAMVAAAIREGV